MNVFSLRSATHPIGKNGNDSSKARHCSVLCVHSPHEKHPSVESSSVTVPTGNRLNDGVSKSFVGGRSCATSIGGQIVSISCRTRMSLSVYFGAACKGGGAGVGNSLQIISSTDSISEGIAGIGISSDTWPVICTGPLSMPIRGRISGSQCLSHIRQLSTISIIRCIWF